MFKTSKLITLAGVAALSLTLGACSNATTNAATTVATTTDNGAKTVSASTANVMTLSTGTFSGRSDHVTTGKVTLEKTANGFQLNFASDFFLDGAPDPIVAIGNDDKYLAANKISTLKNKTGSQVYQLPANFTPGQFSQVYVWCEKFSVPLGIAELSN